MKNNSVYAGGEAYDRIFRALGDPHRLQIIELLKERERSAGEILEAIDVVQSTLSHHMKTLSDSGAVNAVRHGKWTYYSLNEDHLAAASSYLAECAKGTMVRKELPASEGHDGRKKASENRPLASAGSAAPAAGHPENDTEKGTDQPLNLSTEDAAPVSSRVKSEKSGMKTSSEKNGMKALSEKSGKKKEKEKKAKKGKKNKKS